MSNILDQDIGKNSQGREIPMHEAKARKAFSKLGLVPVPDIYRVVVRKKKQTAFVVSQPDIFKSPVGDVYVVFGEAKVDDSQSYLQDVADQALVMQAQENKEKENKKENDDDDDDGEVDETGLDQSEITDIMDRTNCTRQKAVRALIKNGNAVDAILSLADI